MTLIDIALKEIGYTENPKGSNRTKYAAEAGHLNGAPWCATFVVAMCRRSGTRLPSESAYTPTMFQGFMNAQIGYRSGIPQRGDIVFFDFPDSVHRIQHVGICVSSTPTSVTCIEGNTSKGTSGSQDNGGGVYMRTRPLAHVAGYGRLLPPVSPEVPKMADKFVVNAPIVGMSVSSTGKGYTVICADGGIFSFGDAPDYASLGRVEYLLPAGNDWTPAL